MNRIFLCVSYCLLFIFNISSRAENESSAIECIKSATFLAPVDSSGYRKYAPDRVVQILHLALDVTPDFKKRSVEGRATARFKPLALPTQELTLDGIDLTVHSVTSTEKIRAWQVTADKIIVTFAEPIPAEKEASVTIAYYAEPAQGLYFRTPEMGYKDGETHLFSQGEEIEARHWYPCIDSPNAKFTSEITCHVPDGMTVISNGRLVSEDKDPATGLMAAHWSQEKPHANYLISLVAGNFKKIEGRHKAVPLVFYTLPSEFPQAQSSFRDTEGIMAFFEEEIGVPFPWAKYSQVCVNDFVAGGMENTSCTTLTDGTLFADETENIFDSEGLVSHEMAHQWFGDLVTCKDWSHIWLNEGFATYYAALYTGHKNGRDAMLYSLYENARNITGMSNDTNAIVRRTYDQPSEMFNYLAYPKGGWVLHMLRSQLGEDLYRRCIKTYLERHQYGSVVTDDLREVIEELSGRSYDQFFDQWLYHAHHPELEVNYSWDEKAKLARVSIKQSQPVNENVLLFKFSLTIRFSGGFGKMDRTIQVREKVEDFYFPLESAPEVVRVDPNLELLAKITFELPRPMLYAQLANSEDMIGRLLAIQQLSEKHNQEAVTRLKEALNHDAFYGVRIEASRALRSIHTDEALEALLVSAKQPDARVRRQVVLDIGGFYRETARDFAQRTLGTEKNPAILSTTIRDLAGYNQPEMRGLLLKFLDAESYRNQLADAAIAALRAQDDPACIEPLLGTLQKREKDFTSRGFAQGLGALAYLARNEEHKDAVREFLLQCVNRKKKNVHLAALDALGTLRDPKAIAVVETFATGVKDTPERTAAERAVANLRAARQPVDDFKNLRQEVLDLEKANRDLRKELEVLEKKIDARSAPVPSSKKKTTAVSFEPKAH